MFFIYILLTILPVVIVVAFYTLAERKIIASIQRRTGPNIVGFWGVLQPFADGLKAILKEQIRPVRAVFYIFLLAPILTFTLSLLALNFICFKIDRSYFDEYLNFLFFFSISSFHVFGIIFAGWSSNSKYTLLGALRAAAQTFSFEMCFITILLPIFLLNSTFNFIDIVKYQENTINLIVFIPLGIYFFIILLAETNRTPFDLPEAEAELVAGYNLEYSSINFALFFLGEYSNMLLNSCIFVIFFLGGWNLPIKEELVDLILNKSIFFTKIFLLFFNFFFFNFFFKVIFISCLFIIVRALLPRYRYDQLMDLCWKKILPVASSFFLFFIFFIYLNNGFLYNLEISLLSPKSLTIIYYIIT